MGLCFVYTSDVCMTNNIISSFNTVRKVTIEVEYTPPADQNQVSNYKESNFQITSSVTLRCMVGETSGVTHYRWNSTCTSCFSSNSISSTISETFLRSRDAGVHTCTVTDDVGVVGSSSIDMNIVGE